jgi:cysteine desulfuration protein SufE
MSIHQIQEEIVGEFGMLNGDIERIMTHIITLGRILPPIPDLYRVDKNLIQGCHSKVWLASAANANRIHFYGDSDTLISKGLVSLLLRVVDGQPGADILNADLYFIKRSHLERFIGTKRSNGFYAMIAQTKLCVSNFPGTSSGI